MKIGKLVRLRIPDIVEYCVSKDPAEFVRLQDQRYSKEKLDINYPFFRAISKIGPELNVRYWKDTYVVNGVSVRVTSQWFNPPTSKSLQMFSRYLSQLGVDSKIDLSSVPSPQRRSTKAAEKSDAQPASKGRYRGYAIGNAQNATVRNILSRLGNEKFSHDQWARIIQEFGGQCAYCGQSGSLQIEHVFSINRTAMGEHRLGNIVPACPDCNAKKSDQDFRAFLDGQPERIAKIEDHMARYHYQPIVENEMIKTLLENAYREVGLLADRYVNLVEEAMKTSAQSGSD